MTISLGIIVKNQEDWSDGCRPECQERVNGVKISDTLGAKAEKDVKSHGCDH